MFDIARIEDFVDRCNRATDDAELRRVFQTFNVQFDLDVPSDPFSERYSEKQMAIYEQLAGKRYSSLNEVTSFDVSVAAKCPFPYSNGSCELVGNHLMAIGYLLKELALPMGSRVLELGPGWGNLTLALAKTALAVTAVDVEKNFCDLITERAKREGVQIEVINADFGYLETASSQYDAIVFFESFHHAANHRSLMSTFEHVVKPGGVVCFASEPILPDFPIPWGLRMDGESLWAIRRNGWFELGFNEKYFEEAMARAGWALTWKRSKDYPAASVVIAKRLKECGGVFGTYAGKLATNIGKKTKEGAFIADGDSGFLVYGPYVDLPRGKFRAVFSIDRNSAIRGTVDLDISINCGTEIVAAATVDLRNLDSTELKIDFALAQSARAVEARVFCATGTHLTVTELKIFPI